MSWKRFKSGAGWRFLQDSRIVLEDGVGNASRELQRHLEIDDDGAIRTRGEPRTMTLLLEEYGSAIVAASMMCHIPTAWIAGMIAIEADRVPGTLSFDPISIRDEDHAAGDVDRELHDYRARPHRVSAGLMQTLLSTARSMNDQHGWFGDDGPLGASYGPAGSLDLADLCVPERSILLGTAYMRHQVDRYDADPILIVGAYNAGGLYETSRNPWRIRTYGVDRIPKFVAYHNDWLALGAS